VKKAISARSKSRKNRRQNGRIPIIAEIAKESFIEGVASWFSENVTERVINDHDLRQYSSDITSITLTDELKLWLKLHVVYRYCPRREEIFDDYLVNLSAGKFVEYLLDHPFAQHLLNDETIFNLSLLYNHCEQFIIDFLEKNHSMSEFIEYFGLNFDEDISGYYKHHSEKEQFLHLRIPRMKYRIRRCGCNAVDKFTCIEKICVEFEVASVDPGTGQTSFDWIQAEIHLSNLIDKVVKKAIK